MMTKTRRVAGWLGMSGLSAALMAGCAAPPQARAPEDDSTVTGDSVLEDSVDDASAALDQAERDLQSVVLAFGDDDAGGDRSETAPAAPPPAPAAGGTSDIDESRSARKRPDRCVTACRALGSMNRAAGRLCGLAGGEDARCQRAEKRVGSARKLVRRACPSCNA